MSSQDGRILASLDFIKEELKEIKDSLKLINGKVQKHESEIVRVKTIGSVIAFLFGLVGAFISRIIS